VPRTLHVRLDDESEAALVSLRASGSTDSEVVRTALRESAARRRRRAALVAEAAVLADDAADRAEMAAVRGLMESLAPHG
jgi:Arc/MetJ-type ribon-helix-helix transcriptional regulator